MSTPTVLCIHKSNDPSVVLTNTFPAGGLGGGFVLKDLLSQVKLFGIYPKGNGKKSLKDWKQVNNVMGCALWKNPRGRGIEKSRQILLNTEIRVTVTAGPCHSLFHLSSPPL